MQEEHERYALDVVLEMEAATAINEYRLFAKYAQEWANYGRSEFASLDERYAN